MIPVVRFEVVVIIIKPITIKTKCHENTHQGKYKSKKWKLSLSKNIRAPITSSTTPIIQLADILFLLIVASDYLHGKDISFVKKLLRIIGEKPEIVGKWRFYFYLWVNRLIFGLYTSSEKRKKIFFLLWNQKGLNFV